MSKKKKKCIEHGCDKITHGVRCLEHSYALRRKHQDRDEYRSAWYRKKTHNLDQSEFDLLWSIFQGKCGICNNPLILPTRTKGQPLNAAVIDHDHKTGNLRGLLCGACNRGLGLFKDNPDYLNKAKEWVQNE